MSETALEREMAPKRRRMMEMIMALGGLKEESVVPLSKVNEEIANLKSEIEPLTENILAFPSSYFDQFYETISKSDLIAQIGDKGILNEAIVSLESAVTGIDSEGLRGLLEILRNTLNAKTVTHETETSGSSINLENELGSISDLVSSIEEVVELHVKTAETEAQAAIEELNKLIDSFQDILTEMESDYGVALDSLQKLGTKTRYGPFLRAAAQVKRGVREERITPERMKELLSDNLVIEFQRGVMMFILNNMGSKTATQLATLMRASPLVVQKAVVSMLQRSEVEMVGLDENAPVFARVLGKQPDTTLVIKKITQQLRGIRGSIEGKNLQIVDDSLSRLDTVFERLQILGEYDESPLAETITTLRETVDSATEAVLGGQLSERSDDLHLLVSAGLEAFTRFRLKITLEKGPNLVSGFNVYGEKLDPEVYRQLMDTYLENEMERGTLLILIRELGAMTAHDLAEKTNIPQDRVFQHLLRLKRDELLLIAGEAHGYVLYDVPRTLSEAEVTIKTVTALALQLSQASSDLKQILGDLKPQDIGRLATALEVFSKALEKLTKIEVSGTVVGVTVLSSVEEKLKSAVLLTYRTRAKIPSTRPKVTLDDLMDIDVPSVLDEYRDQMGYAPILGFGTINWEQAKCLGCKSCEISCPEDAILLKPKIEIPMFFEFSPESIEELPSNRALFYQTVRGLATEKPTQDIILEKESPGFGTVEVDLWLCVACRTCVRTCPGPDGGALDLELKWSLPEVVRQMTTEH